METSSLLGRVAVAGLFLSAMFVTSARASNLGVVNANNVSLRSYNSYEAVEVAKANNTETVTIVANANNGWFEIEKRDGSNLSAFIDADYLQITQTDATVMTNGVYVRCRPALDSAPYGTVDKGEVFVVTGRWQDWYQIKYEGYTGYIYKDYMQGSLLPYLKEITLPESVTNPTKVSNVSGTTAIANTAAKYEISREDSVYGVVISDTLNLRLGANVKSEILKVLPCDYNISVLDIDSNQGWLRVVDDDGIEGFVYGAYLTLKNGEKPENSESSYLPADIEEVKDDEKDLTPVMNSNATPTQASLISYAEQWVGTPYVFGGTDLQNGVDCSGFVMMCYRNLGINLNRTSREMFLQGTPVEREDLQPGDLVFFNTGGDTQISHVGMYYGDGKYIHSTDGSAHGVTIADFNGDYPTKTYVGARRILES
ncbi:MAG: C40 family peptidase [Firmicutes bacterium]|nr:C40 family peptidase [Bacillota bacterium]